jgi:hypothetical protein
LRTCFDRLLGGAGLIFQARADHHLGCHQEQEQAAGDLEGRRRDSETVQQELPGNRGAEQDGCRNRASPHGDLLARLLRQASRQSGKDRHEADRIDHHQHGDEGGNHVVERHVSGLARALVSREQRSRVLPPPGEDSRAAPMDCRTASRTPH